MSDRGTTTVRTEELRERCRFLRGCVPGDELRLDCSDDRTRTVDVDARIEVQNGMVILNCSGHGTSYQLNVAHDGTDTAFGIDFDTDSDTALGTESDTVLEPVCCEFCGLPVDENDQCPALDDGECRP